MSSYLKKDMTIVIVWQSKHMFICWLSKYWI